MKGKDVYWEAQPPFAVSRVLGVAPVDVTFSLSKTNLVVNVVWLSFTIFIGVTLWIYMEHTNKLFALSGFQLILERAQLIIVLATVAVSSIKSITNVKTLSGMMRQLESLDKQLYEIGILVPYSRFYGYALTAAKLALIMSILLPDFLLFKSWSSLRFLIVQYILIYPLLLGNIVQVQFMVLQELVQRRIRLLIERLSDVERGNNFIRTSHLQVLVSIHSSLIDICETINSLYSPQILIIVSSIFIVTTANLYHVIEKLVVFVTFKKSSDMNFLGMTSYRIIVRSLEVWTIVTTCVNTQDLAKEFNVKLYQVMTDDKYSQISGIKNLRLHISLCRVISFTAWGYFNLDYTLVHSMVAAATTYLVILVQFGNPATAANNKVET